MITEPELEALSPGEPGIRTNSLPGPRTRDVLDRLDGAEFSDGFEAGSPIAISGGQGIYYEDHDGNRFMDLNIMVSLAYLGMGHPAVNERAGQYVRAFNRAGSPKSEIRAELEERILAIAPHSMRDGRVLLTLTGTMANEIAVRMAMRATGRRRIVAFSNCYHGGWGVMWEIAGQARYRGYDWGDRTQTATHIPFPNCYRCPYGRKPDDCGLACADFMEHLLAAPNTGVDDVACVIVEAVQNSGHVPAPPGWMKRLRRICDRIGAMLVVDALANGFVVSGDVFSHEAQGADADIVTIGKGIANSMPLAAVIFSAEAAERARGIAAYNGGNAHPVVMAAGVATLDAMFDSKADLMGRTKVLESAARERLDPWAATSAVAGDLRIMGLTGCIELVRDKESREPVASGLVEGTVLNTMLRSTESPGSLLLRGYPLSPLAQHGNVIRWCVPMTTPMAAYLRMIDAVTAAVDANAEALGTR
ncbi:MAG: aspartate aminotransferase family protein [Alphaproteobacteria bacterium]|nr:MAG: aspartate aminotransferase family protein [Alphaproteobacteria bacterium]